MSTAAKCDLCGVLFERAKGNVSVTYTVESDSKGSHYEYGGEDDGAIDLCSKHGAEFLKFIRHKEPRRG